MRHLFLFLIMFSSLLFQLILSWPFNSSSSSSNKLCFPEQSFALLHFKNSISVVNDSSIINTWKESSDCCSWYGVTCDTFTGHVIGLDLSCSWLHGTIHDNSSLFLLHHLQRLNLSSNNFFGSKISSKFGQFRELTHLDLSSCNFSGLLPNEIFHLSKLVSLYLSNNDFDIFGLELRGDGSTNMLQNLTKLKHLNLDFVNMASVSPASLVNMSSSLMSLSLASTNLEGRFPSAIFHLPLLQWLSLSDNYLLTGNLPKSNWSGPLRFLNLSQTLSFSSELPDTIGSLKYLNKLDLFQSNFRGSIPPSLGNLTAITSLRLSQNYFTGRVPTSISKLVQLTSLDLHNNSFSGQFPDVLGNLSKLTFLSLTRNNFSGPLPSSAFTLPKISELLFSENQFGGQIPNCQVNTPPPLKFLYLQNNKLLGPIPNFVFDLVNITELDLSSNNLSGILKLDMFSKLNRVEKIDLSSNNFSGILKSEMFSKLKSLKSIDLSHNSMLSLTPCNNSHFTLPNLEYFLFSSCNLTTVPMFLRYANNLQSIDLSSNRISGHIFGYEMGLTQNLRFLDLSHNFLTSFQNIPLDFNPLFLDLQSNLLQGPLFDMPFDRIFYFSVSNNNLTAEIPSFFCNLRSLQYLSLSNNSLNGTIPNCLQNIESLLVLDMGMNNFHGSIPQSLANKNLQYLGLNSNQLEGPLPSFVNSSALQVLDVGNNQIMDTFPSWLSSLPKLQVLILRCNRFHGLIGHSTIQFPFPEIRILDLSHNQFSGPLPVRYFENFKAMMQGAYHNVDREFMQISPMVSRGEYYSTTLTLKGDERTIDHLLNIFIAIDLSDNLFEGGIPEVLGQLNSLKVLNFSHNRFTGHIPTSIQNLTEVESLDLSSNNLTGEIPTQMTRLTYLAVLNLSYNQLVGPIPHGNQFETFQNGSFAGNLGLCGLQLSKECGDNKARQPKGPTAFHEEYDSLSLFDWKVFVMGYGCGMVGGLSMGYIVFTTRKPQWFLNMVERKQLTNVRRLSGRCRGRRNC